MLASLGVNRVTINEAATELGVSRATVYRLLERHGLDRYFRPGDRHAYVDLDALKELRERFEPRNRS